MKITRISAWIVPLTSHEAYYMADGKTCDTVDSVVLRLDTDVGDPEDGAIEGFAIAGEDRVFHPATAVHAVKGKDRRGRTQYEFGRQVPWKPAGIRCGTWISATGSPAKSVASRIAR